MFVLFHEVVICELDIKMLKILKIRKLRKKIQSNLNWGKIESELFKYII